MNDVLQIVNLAGVLGLMGFVWNIANGNKKKVSYDSFDRYKKDTEEKMTVDKKEVKEEFRTKELCDTLHKQVNEKLSCIPEIKEVVGDIKEGLIEIKTKVDILINGKS